MIKVLMLVMAVLLATGCSNIQWSRLAPPGIIKYEQIADEKPANPAIQSEIDARRDDDKPPFPKLAETRSAGAPPSTLPSEEIDAAIDDLEQRRENLEANLSKDRAAVEADREDTTVLINDREALAEQLERDETAAKRERSQSNE